PRARMTELSITRPETRRMGFFTDTTVCIGCKACEVACKQWNDLPADGGTFRRCGSYDNTAMLGAITWRHVRFVELADAGRGVEGAYLYGADEEMAGGLGAFFLLTQPPERYGLPANADSPIQENVVPATLAAVGAGLLAAAGVAAAFISARRRA